MTPDSRAMSTAPATKRELTDLLTDLKALMRKRDWIARRWMLAILLIYSLALMAELWMLLARETLK
jgi:hypothetical protein